MWNNEQFKVGKESVVYHRNLLGGYQALSPEVRWCLQDVGGKEGGGRHMR